MNDHAKFVCFLDNLEINSGEGMKRVAFCSTLYRKPMQLSNFDITFTKFMAEFWHTAFTSSI